MTRPTRPAAPLLAAALFALAGCGKPADPTDKGPPAKGLDPAPAAAPPGPSAPAGPVGPTDASSVAAEKFAADLVAGKGDPAKLSGPFLKAVGLPALAPEDKAKGYSPATAQAWLNRVGAGLSGIAPPAGVTAGGTAVFVGPAGNGTGRYLVRMVQADGAWKADWFGIGTAKANDPPKPKDADEAFQDFAVLAFLDSITSTATPPEDRIPAAAAVLSAGTRGKWAAPFPADQDQGFDYNQAKLGQIMGGFGGGATAVSRTRTGADTFRVELTKPDGTATYAVKLTRGPAGGWVIDEFQRQ